MSIDTRFLDRCVQLGGLVEATFALGLSATWLGLLGDLWWFFDLFAHFRSQYLAVSVLALAWFLWRECRSGIIVASASLLLNASLVFGWFRGSPAGQAAQGFRLRAVSINVHTSNHAADKVVEFVRQANADVVFLMEVDEWWANALAHLKQLYPHSLIESREDNFGVAFYSKLENTRSRVEWFGDADVPTVVAELRHNGKDIRFIGTHPLPPTGAEYSGWRNSQLHEMREFVGKGDRPALLIGDLNATPWSAGMRILTQDNKLRLPAPEFQWSPSWLARSPLAIPIDHALATLPLFVLSRKVGPDVGSDHRPIVVEVGWDQPGF